MSVLSQENSSDLEFLRDFSDKKYFRGTPVLFYDCKIFCGNNWRISCLEMKNENNEFWVQSFCRGEITAHKLFPENEFMPFIRAINHYTPNRVLLSAKQFKKVVQVHAFGVSYEYDDATPNGTPFSLVPACGGFVLIYRSLLRKILKHLNTDYLWIEGGREDRGVRFRWGNRSVCVARITPDPFRKTVNKAIVNYLKKQIGWDSLECELL